MSSVDIAAFLSARFDEEHADAITAQEADPSPWRDDTTDGGSTNERSGHGFGLVIAGDNTALWDCEGSLTLCMTAPTARHVARWDPARVLAEVEAKRAMLESLAIAERDSRSYWGNTPQGAARVSAWIAAIRLMAAPYADHPDYNPAWAVT